MASKSTHVAISNGCDENGSLSVTGLEQGTFQRWKTIVDVAHLDYSQSVFIAWNTDCTKYLTYYIDSIDSDDDYRYTRHELYPGHQVRHLLYLLFFPPYLEAPLYTVPLDWLRQIFAAHISNAFGWSRRNEIAAVASKEDGLSIIDLLNNQIYRLTAETNINALAWSPQDRILAAGTDHGQITLWEAEGTKLFSINVDSHSINAIAWNPDGTQVAVSHGYELSVYQVK